MVVKVLEPRSAAVTYIMFSVVSCARLFRSSNMSLTMETPTTKMRGSELKMAPLGGPTSGIIYRSTQKRKYAFATLVNWMNRFLGRKLRHVYFVVVTLLFMKLRPGSFF